LIPIWCYKLAISQNEIGTAMHILTAVSNLFKLYFFIDLNNT